jgi:hypothetical protein
LDFHHPYIHLVSSVSLDDANIDCDSKQSPPRASALQPNEQSLGRIFALCIVPLGSQPFVLFVTQCAGIHRNLGVHHSSGSIELDTNWSNRKRHESNHWEREIVAPLCLILLLPFVCVRGNCVLCSLVFNLICLFQLDDDGYLREGAGNERVRNLSERQPSFIVFVPEADLAMNSERWI